MRGCHILEGVVVLPETIHELHRKKMDDVILKIDFEKACDKVHWIFFTTSTSHERFCSQMV
jgi:hypothetical protein